MQPGWGVPPSPIAPISAASADFQETSLGSGSPALFLLHCAAPLPQGWLWAGSGARWSPAGQARPHPLQRAKIRISVQRMRGASSGASLPQREPREGATKGNSTLILGVWPSCLLSLVLVRFRGQVEQSCCCFAGVPTPRLGCGQKCAFLEQPGVSKPLYFGLLGINVEDILFSTPVTCKFITCFFYSS